MKLEVTAFKVDLFWHSLIDLLPNVIGYLSLYWQVVVAICVFPVSMFVHALAPRTSLDSSFPNSQVILSINWVYEYKYSFYPTFSSDLRRQTRTLFWCKTKTCIKRLLNVSETHGHLNVVGGFGR